MSHLARPATRALFVNATIGVAPRRLYASTVPPTPPPGSKTHAASGGGGGGSSLPIVLGLAAVGGLGYYYLAVSGKDEEVKAKAKELEHAAEGKRKELKADAQAKIAGAQVSLWTDEMGGEWY
jgi:hypothetical protein